LDAYGGRGKNLRGGRESEGPKREKKRRKGGWEEFKGLAGPNGSSGNPGGDHKIRKGKVQAFPSKQSTWELLHRR